jgi:hypothetical protein
MEYTPIRALVCIALALIANNVGFDLEKIKAMNRIFHILE